MNPNIKVSLRRLVREKQYSIINVGGLAISMAGALLILLFLQFELSYDRYHPEYERTYRLATDAVSSGEREVLAINSFPVAPLMASGFSEITDYTRVFPFSFFFREVVYRYEDRSFFEDGVFAADSTFFDFFHFEFIHGRPDNALTEPFSIVLTRDMAERYFQDEDPLGKMLRVDGSGSFRVTGVIENPPLNSHMQFEGLISMSSLNQLGPLFESALGPGASFDLLAYNFNSRTVWAYVKTTEGFDPDLFIEDHWDTFYENHLSEAESGIDYKSSLLFQPIHTIHLQSDLPYEMAAETGTISMMSLEVAGIFFAIALFLLLIASINYTNLAISRFTRRSKEVGVRKVMGAGKGQLVRQFMTESVITTVLALLLALVLAELVVPSVNNMLNVSITTNIVSNPAAFLILLGMAVFVGLVAGGYPSLYFTSFPPVKVLTHRFVPGRSAMSLKKMLIVIQFVISIFMVIATLVVNAQLRYINQKDLGYDYENVMIVEMQGERQSARAADFRQRLLRQPGVVDATVSNYFPSVTTMQNNININQDQGSGLVALNFAQTGPEFLQFMGMEMAEGRFFDPESHIDLEESIVINEAALRQIGWEEPLSHRIHAHYRMADWTDASRRVIGVVKDFHYAPLGEPIEPMAFFPMEEQGNFMLIRFSGENTPGNIALVRKAWSEFAPDNPFTYRFLEEEIGGFYESQKVLSRFFGSFALLCILISFLGVYGLSAYSAEQRTREIGIRKVLGASLQNVLFMLNKEFSWLLVIAFAIAAPLAWHAMDRWLAGFAHSTDLTVWPFLLAAVVAFLVTFMAVGYHAWRSMRRNPAETLQYE